MKSVESQIMDVLRTLPTDYVLNLLYFISTLDDETCKRLSENTYAARLEFETWQGNRKDVMNEV